MDYAISGRILDPPNFFFGFEKSSVTNDYCCYFYRFACMEDESLARSGFSKCGFYIVPRVSMHRKSSSLMFTVTFGRSLVSRLGSYTSFMSVRKSSTFSTERAYPIAVVDDIG